MKLTRILAIVLLLSMSLGSLIACTGATVSGTDGKVLLCYAGDSRDEFGGSVYHAAIQEAKCGFHTVELGKNATNYQATVEEALNQSGAEIVVIVGREAYNGLADYIKSFRGMNFIVVDASLTEIPANVCALEFQPEEYGYLSGKLAAASGAGDVGYLSVWHNHFDNRILYGFLQGVENKKVHVRYMEEATNVVKAADYVKTLAEENVSILFDRSGRSSLGGIDAAKQASMAVLYGDINLKLAAAESKSAETIGVIAGGVAKNYNSAMKAVQKMAKTGFETGKAVYLTAKEDAFVADGIDAGSVVFPEGSTESFESLCQEKIVNGDLLYSPKYSVEAPYHEAIPACADTNDWKYAPRAGSGNGMKPLGWKGIGIWSTIYLQQDQKPVSNTGIEFQNMKLWAYTRTTGWVLLEHANPKGAFYDENFSGDSHKDFRSNFINYESEKRTRIKLDYGTLGYNYHPFGSQIDLVEAGLLNPDGSVINGDTLYILSEMDIRLCVWDASQPSDMDDAKYVANIGADWWREKGLSWTPDWNSNKDVCVGQFRTITKDWKRLYMTNVPADLYEEIFSDFPFDH